MKKTRRVKVILSSLIISFMIMSMVLGQVSATSSQLISKVTTTDKVIALTFDDGSDGGNAEAILAILASYNVKATFFVTGQGAQHHPDIIKKMAAAGHPLGNHSYSHPYFTQISASQMVSELQQTETIIKNLTGKSTIPYFRPPYGAYNSTVLQVVGDAGYTKTIYWTIDTIDWSGVSTAAITSKVLDNATPGAIVLMHTGDGATNTKNALPTIITTLRSRGYQFVTVPELVNHTYSTSTTPPISDATIDTWPTLKYGSVGTAVKQLQQMLTYYKFQLVVDGIFGPKTLSAVKAFQTSRGIAADGIVGPITRSKLKTGTTTTTPTTTTAPVSNATIDTWPTLKYGSVGTAVKQLQQMLTYYKFPLVADGVFGPKTLSAVKAFQTSRGIAADGIVGPITRSKLKT
ncbi:MAG: polysaccharide deacetylase family protein [Erysipelotrichaceae bacterium]|nr:polysaccharide deacetylase family protein [Erysipelotrichaceae bacterium]MDD3810098.1 polysaccharide deacetylase family protein [Erysipelotrichaceae bacterium]